MTNPSDREVEVFSAARRLPAEQRSAWLDETCAGDPALRQRVEELLQAGEEAGAFLQEPAPGAQRPAEAAGPPNAGATLRIPPAPTEKAGDRIGRYKLLQQIGEGGCGVVYMAEQEEPVRRRVALKVIKLGMDTKQVVARFEAERQALALMDHPNIAKVFDAGATETGRPYFVMELVRGIKITDYCDENNVSTEERLELFIQVCQAVQHAHQKGIIHRDLKPSNILVADHDGVAVPKIIDFGIAKATTDQRLTDKTLFTAFEQFIGTPAYMSPEQARMSGLDIDTRTDIYSLGVLLYELLTGKTPFDAQDLLAAGLDEMRRTISEKEPARPSTRLSTMLEGELTTTAKHRQIDAPKLIHLLRGDLDWIVMKALEKDRARRYETANGLARDIQRHLNCEPVIARPPSRLYEFQKTVRRHKLGFGAAAAVITVLVFGVSVSTWQAIRARRAEREQSRLREAAQQEQANEAKLRQKAETEAAKANAVSEFLQEMVASANPDKLKGSDYTVRQLLDDFSAGLVEQLAGQPEVEATVQATIGNAYYRLGATDKAEPHLERALALRRRLYGEQSEEVAQSLVDHAWNLSDLARRSEAEAEARRALDIYHAHGADAQPVIHALCALVVFLNLQERFQEVEVISEEALALARNSRKRDFPEMANILHNLADTKVHEAKFVEAENLALQAVEMHRRLHGPQHPETAWSLLMLGRALAGQHKLAEAERAFREALSIFRKYYSFQHTSVQGVVFELSAVLEAKGDFSAVEGLNREVLAEERATLGNDSPAVAETLGSLAASLYAQSKQAEAEKASREAMEIILKLRGKDLAKLPPRVRRLAEALKSQGKAQDGEKLFEEAIKGTQQELGETNLVLGALFHDYGEFLQHEDKTEAAAECHLKSLAIRRAQPDDDLAQTLRNLGGELVLIGRLREAEAYLRESLTLYRKLHQQEDIYGTAWASERLGFALYQQHKLPEAESAYREALAACTKCKALDSDEFAVGVRSFLDVLKAENKLADGEALCRAILVQQRAAFTNDNPAVAQTLFSLAENLVWQGKQAEAKAACREAIAVVKQLAQAGPKRSDYAVRLGHSQWQLADVLAKTGRPDQAEQVLREALQVFEQAARAFPAELLLRQEQAYSRRALADVLRESGRLDEAERERRAAIVLYASLTTAAPANLWYHQEQAYSSWELAAMLESGGRLDAAEAEYRRAIELHEKASVAFPKETVLTGRLATLKVRLVELLCRRGRLAEAKSMYREAAEHGTPSDLDAFAELLATSPDPNSRDGPNAVIFAEKAVAETKRKNANYLDTLAAAYAEAGQFAKAISTLQEAIALSQSEQEKKDFATRLKLYENNSPYRNHNSLAELTRDRLLEGKFTEAEGFARECLSIREKQLPDDWRTFNAKSLLGAALLGQKKYAEAEPLLLSGYEGMKQREINIPLDGKVRLSEAIQRLVQLCEATDRPDQAAEWKKKLPGPDKAQK